VIFPFTEDDAPDTVGATVEAADDGITLDNDELLNDKSEFV
jgi:hypothetical protein